MKSGDNIVPIGVGVIGFGLSARVFHLPFIDAVPEFELAAISTSQKDEASGSWPNASVFADAQQVIAHPDVDLIIITAPNDAHFSLAKQALVAGKHVLLEKPFVTNVGDGEELVKLAQQSGCILSVFHNRRWDGDFLTVKKLLSDGTLGKIRFFETHFDRFRPNVRDTWRERGGEGSGILFDLGSHLIDQTVVLFGMPRAVTAQVTARRDNAKTDDMFRLSFHYDDMLAVLVSSPFCAGPNLRFKVEGEAGSYVKYGLDPQEERLRAGLRPVEAGWAEETADAYGTIYTGHGDTKPCPTEVGGYDQFFHGLANAVNGGGPPPVAGREALAVIQLIEVARRSATLGQTVSVC
ncbi:oxidoreductase [Kordiimonas aestuarii]|uniref:oxidoreductase n=1 Tax=Kordiimonas aestuarii TaxID=1005925 RepID=UPI0021D20B63|nr:oxidoreductase [Kordiimonas aestuarii]